MAEFGQTFTTKMVVSSYCKDQWTQPEVKPLEPLSLHPATHVLHYSSTCFEGLKAYQWQDGSIHLFRHMDNVRRLINSAKALCLPVPSEEHLEQMIKAAVTAVADEIPALPGSLYIRPTLIGTEKHIGAAGRGSKEALLYVITSPVGDYFSGGMRPLKLLIDDQSMRSTPHFGQVKTGGNYAAALGSIKAAREAYGVDQVLFCPDGVVQETGAANFILIKDNTFITKRLDGSILPGITRDSVLRLAEAGGYQVRECDYTVDELLSWLPDSEAFLSGTAAVLSPVGSVVYQGKNLPVGNGEIGPQVLALREQLTGVQNGQVEDQWGWTSTIA